MSTADALAYELATADARKRHEFAKELAELRAFASCASANRRRLPSALQQLLAKLPGGPRRSSPPPEPAELEPGQSKPLF